MSGSLVWFKPHPCLRLQLMGPLGLAVPVPSSSTQRPVVKKAHQKTAAQAGASLNRGPSMASTSQGRAGLLSLSEANLLLTSHLALLPPLWNLQQPQAPRGLPLKSSYLKERCQWSAKEEAGYGLGERDGSACTSIAKNSQSWVFVHLQPGEHRTCSQESIEPAASMPLKNSQGRVFVQLAQPGEGLRGGLRQPTPAYH